jgi:acyl-CoA synthetase (AMP-forming)/AMP-acid ligase II
VLITLYEDGDQAIELSYAALHADGVAMAAGLRALGLERGDKVAIMLPTGREFFAAFFGALLAGLVPVPLYPPARPSQLEDHLKRVAGILRNARARDGDSGARDAAGAAVARAGGVAALGEHGG